MPRHDYICHTCSRIETDVFGSIPTCHGSMELYFGNWKTLRTQSSYLDNHMFNNGQGSYDPGLGKVIRDRAQHRRLMAEQKVDVVNTSYDNFMASLEKEPPAPDISMDYVKDTWDREEAEFNKGKRMPEPMVRPDDIPDNIKVIGE